MPVNHFISTIFIGRIPQTKQIRAPQDLQELLRALLQTHLTGDTPTIAQRLYPNADWRYHIQSAAQEVSV